MCALSARVLHNGMLHHALGTLGGHKKLYNFIGLNFPPWTTLACLPSQGTREAIRASVTQLFQTFEHQRAKKIHPSTERFLI